ncbi:uncharacterized mitochondrial protein AtMg00810-like [Solanum tuberosum]|uniref:uncharacterized mitochondrial protein AtMg00810-like n=1 Tax=Solanum tuberosum TaxID=4113 RepID=UPI00073A37E6|nr:PREDICTED: uncharacterized mitochondrial protein AtMg00810-like [Solanum tuberosum]
MFGVDMFSLQYPLTNPFSNKVTINVYVFCSFMKYRICCYLNGCQSHYDYSLFTKQAGDAVVVILVYVDDLLITGSSHELLCRTKQDIQKRFKMKDLGELKFFLGIEFSRSSKGILMTQRQYALELVSETGLGGAKPTEDDEPLTDPTQYQRLVGRLLYLTMTRPDLAFTAQVLSQFMHSPKQSHMEATLRAVRYIKESPGLGLLMPAEQTTQLTAYCDSDWVHV